ncbi:MAG: Co2+/Mg2+ efflux protein ApaG [Myxococcota bacterium]|nr:Co2+/Mg2+ efflux protein ApaG [Myxococcota bacterium]MEE2780054.1 Co2+/Mg2+ efflux protein ApaG [Myxococcota bacterium]
MGESATQNVRIQVQSFYVPERSQPEFDAYFFAYRVRISNEGDEGVRLLSRHWVITDGDENVQEVRGEGVVGEQPHLGPGERFEYTSACPLRTVVGTMMGSYQMVTDAGQKFDAEIAPFTLAVPSALN